MKKINIKCFFPTDNGHLRLVVVFKLILKNIKNKNSDGHDSA